MLAVLFCVQRVGSFVFARALEMMFTAKFSLSNIHVRLTAKGLLRNLQLLSGCKKNTLVFCAGLFALRLPFKPPLTVAICLSSGWVFQCGGCWPP